MKGVFIACYLYVRLPDYKSAILQRVLSASVTVDKQLISSIGRGILVFAAVALGDTEKDVETLATKVLKMRLVRASEHCYHSLYLKPAFFSQKFHVITICQCP
jgi:hypothetical protein